MTLPSDHWDSYAREKLTRVLGASIAEAMYARGVAELGYTTLASSDDLHQFARWLQSQQGFAAAVGAMLSVHAVVHGAAG